MSLKENFLKKRYQQPRQESKGSGMQQEEIGFFFFLKIHSSSHNFHIQIQLDETYNKTWKNSIRTN